MHTTVRVVRGHKLPLKKIPSLKYLCLSVCRRRSLSVKRVIVEKSIDDVIAFIVRETQQTNSLKLCHVIDCLDHHEIISVVMVRWTQVLLLLLYLYL